MSWFLLGLIAGVLLTIWLVSVDAIVIKKEKPPA